MEFGSKYVYKYDCSSDESMSDDDCEIQGHVSLGEVAVVAEM